MFFAIHDPTTKDRQGGDVGTQYRSAIFVTSPAQRATAQAVIAEITAQALYPAPVVTEIQDLTSFWPAEEEHDDYFALNPYSGYCQAVVAPKVLKFRKSFADRLKAHAA
jgi:peptide-methionine (S)-S-oxide reductase